MNGVELIAEERRRQIEVEGWDAAHDDGHRGGELALAAALYASPVRLYEMRETPSTVIEFSEPWPWWSEAMERGHRERAWDKRAKHDRVRQLVIAGALIAAELDRLQRVSESESNGKEEGENREGL